jgi:hypothetical protein
MPRKVYVITGSGCGPVAVAGSVATATAIATEYVKAGNPDKTTPPTATGSLRRDWCTTLDYDAPGDRNRPSATIEAFWLY